MSDQTEKGLTPGESMPTSKELPTIEGLDHEFDQVLGLSSCPEDAEGKPCELCTEQITRLREAQHRATLAAVRTRLVATDPVGLKTLPLFDWLTQEMAR